MRLRTLGVSGSAPGPTSPASTYLIQIPQATVAAGIKQGSVPEDVALRDWNIVVDLGNGGLGILQRHVRADQLDAVCLSHLHADHCADLSCLYVHLKYHPEHGALYTGIDPNLPVYGPSDLRPKIHALTGDVGGGSDMFDLRIWWAGYPTRIGPIVITPVPVWHPVESYGMRIQGPSTMHGGRPVLIAYTGDTDYCEGVVAVARDADLLLCEAAFVEGRDDVIEPGIHLTGRRAGMVATESGAQRVLLTHIPSWNNSQIALAEAREEYDGPMGLAKPDGVVVL